MIEKVFSFVKANKDMAFATVGEDGKPKIRVFQIMLIDEVEKVLFFATLPKKEVFKQLKNNPNIEILSYADNISVRISGKTFFDVSDAVCEKIYRENPVLLRLYKQYTDLVYFRLRIKKAEYYDLNSTTPTHECFISQNI